MINIEEYTNIILESNEFKRLKELKDIIDKKYTLLIISMKNSEANYLEAKKYGQYYPGIKELQTKFVEAKTKLYSMPEVKEYFELERKIQNLLNEDLNDLKSSISNKFVLDEIYKIF